MSFMNKNCVRLKEGGEATQLRSFSEVRHSNHFPSDEELTGFVEWRRLSDPLWISSYKYWSSVIPQPEDEPYLRPSGGAMFYSHLTSLLLDKLQIFYWEESRRRRQLVTGGSLTEYANSQRQRLAMKGSEFTNRAIEGSYPDRRDALFANLLQDSAGLMFNLVSVSPSFVMYRSREMLKVLNQKEWSVLPTERIYLNPNPDRVTEVARALIERFDQDDNALPVMMKIFNRAIESGRLQSPSRIRSEGLVVYAFSKQADDALNEVLTCQQAFRTSFIRRSTPPLAATVVDGVAIASDQGFNARENSFVSHRTSLINNAFYQAKLHETTEIDMSRFKQAILTQLNACGIDYRNMAFPKDYNSHLSTGL